MSRPRYLNPEFPPSTTGACPPSHGYRRSKLVGATPLAQNKWHPQLLPARDGIGFFQKNQRVLPRSAVRLQQTAPILFCYFNALKSASRGFQGSRQDFPLRYAAQKPLPKRLCSKARLCARKRTSAQERATSAQERPSPAPSLVCPPQKARPTPPP